MRAPARRRRPTMLARIATARSSGSASPLDRLLAPSSPRCREAVQHAGARRAGARRRAIRSSRDGALRACRVHCASATSSSASSRRAATTSIRPRPTTTRIWCRRTAISPSTPGCARSFGAHADRAHRQARQSRMAAGQGAGAVGRRASRRRRSGPLPHLYPFIVNDPGEGTQAKRRAAAGHHRPPDAAADARRELRPAARSRAAGRRVLRGGRARSAPLPRCCATRSSTSRAAHRPRPRLRHRARRRAPTRRSASSTTISAS